MRYWAVYSSDLSDEIPFINKGSPEALTGVIVGQEQLRAPEFDGLISFSCFLTQLFSKVVSIWHKALCEEEGETGFL